MHYLFYLFFIYLISVVAVAYAPATNLCDRELRPLPAAMLLRLSHSAAHLVQSQMRRYVSQNAVLHLHIECDAHLSVGLYENAAGGELKYIHIYTYIDKYLDICLINESSSFNTNSMKSKQKCRVFRVHIKLNQIKNYNCEITGI